MIIQLVCIEENKEKKEKTFTASAKCASNSHLKKEEEANRQKTHEY